MVLWMRDWELAGVGLVIRKVWRRVMRFLGKVLDGWSTMVRGSLFGMIYGLVIGPFVPWCMVLCLLGRILLEFVILLRVWICGIFQPYSLIFLLVSESLLKQFRFALIGLLLISVFGTQLGVILNLAKHILLLVTNFLNALVLNVPPGSGKSGLVLKLCFFFGNVTILAFQCRKYLLLVGLIFLLFVLDVWPLMNH